jgi:hypothetical protein
MFLISAARSGVSAVRTAVRLAASAGAHVAWWVDYNVGGRPHDQRQPSPPPPPRKR